MTQVFELLRLSLRSGGLLQFATPSKFKCVHSLYTLKPNIQDTILLSINLTLRRKDRTPRGMIKHTITLSLQDICPPT